MRNVSKDYENGTLQVSYEYDKINRLVRENNKQLGFTVLFTYDNNGNIRSERTYNYSTALLEDLTHYKEQHEYYYSPNSDKLIQIASRVLNDSNEYVETIKNFDYDIIGNAEVWNSKTATYSKGRQLASFDGTTFTYNGLGQRTSKTSSNSTINFTYDSSGKLIGQSNGLEFIYDQSGVSGFMYNGNIYHYAKNLQKDIVKILDFNGNVVVKYIYDAWGNYAVETDMQVTKYGTADKISLAELNPFRYRSYYYDTETELYYLKTRYYDPKIGRFITIDDTQYLAPDQINGLNLYAYCGNNPVIRVDLNGTSWSDFWRGALSVVAIVGGIALCFVPGAQAIGAGLIVFGAGGLIGGAISVANGGSFSDGWDIGALIGGIVGLVIAAPQLIGLAVEFLVPQLSLASAANGLMFSVIAGTTAVAVPVGAIAMGVAGVGLVALGANVLFVEHTKNKRKSNKNKHEKGQTQRQREKFGGEKGDSRRPYSKWKRNNNIIFLSFLFKNIIGLMEN